MNNTSSTTNFITQRPSGKKGSAELKLNRGRLLTTLAFDWC